MYSAIIGALCIIQNLSHKQYVHIDLVTREIDKMDR